jgi:hypothetical protein
VPACGSARTSQFSISTPLPGRAEGYMVQACKVGHMKHIVAGLVLGLVVATNARAGELSIFEHNGSVIEWFVVQDAITATYKVPRKGLAEAGIKPGAKLFEGVYEDSRIVGKAFAFKLGCPRAEYDVIGYQKDKKIHLDGPAPVRTGCSVTRYSASSPHARLVFTYSATHH